MMRQTAARLGSEQDKQFKQAPLNYGVKIEGAH